LKNKILLCIADGVGDRPCENLGFKTPLQYAKTPHLDKLAKDGQSGIMDLHKAGTPVGTDLGHLILFGYSIKDYPGRGPLEAFGENVELVTGDVAFRCNFATIDENGNVKDRRAGRIREGTTELANALNGMQIDDVTVIFKEATEHRAVLVLRGKGLSDAITDTDPKIEGVPVKKPKATNDCDEAIKTAKVLAEVQKKAIEILSAHPLNKERESQGLLPANCILTRGAGSMPDIKKITERLKFKACCIAAESTVIGVARLAGFSTIYDPAFTGNIDTNIDKKSDAAVKALKENDFVVLHFKATDLMGHDNNPEGKVKAVEKFDALVGLALEKIKKEDLGNVIVALAADHSTPCERREHSGDPVPVVISGKNIRNDDVEKFDEVSSAKGALCRMQGSDFCNTLYDYLEVTKKEGN